ncbi:MAG: hypothetical protein AW07_02120 [Candidatus Accumulibacter sp. SK-11]|nr:MAG: hypothetical protein AW07_02120 [Candidatus Accumulibacter sp. SK-11]
MVRIGLAFSAKSKIAAIEPLTLLPNPYTVSPVRVVVSAP